MIFCEFCRTACNRETKLIKKICRLAAAEAIVVDKIERTASRQ
jgi:hypothetical protein